MQRYVGESWSAGPVSEVWIAPQAPLRGNPWVRHENRSLRPKQLRTLRVPDCSGDERFRSPRAAACY